MAAVATNVPKISKNGRWVEKISVAWTSDASGNATVAIAGMYGFIMKAVTIPDGTAAPTDLYDITLIDENGIDALGGALADRSTSAKQQVAPVLSGGQLPVFLAGDHTFTVANAGNAKVGTCVFYIVECL